MSKEKKYLSIEELAKQSDNLSCILSGATYGFSIKDIEKGKIWLYKSTPFFMQDRELGRVRAIFHYEGDDSLQLEYSPYFLKEGTSKEMPRKKVPLTESLELPLGYYLLGKN
jgi:hypothetical protein